MNQVIAVYSETGGTTKTTTAVSTAVCAALMGHKVDLFDLDPRAATTKWLGVTPKEEWQHVGAILGAQDPTGWANDLALPSPWPEVPNLRIIPSARALSNREKTVEDHSDVRLRMSMEGSTADITVLDMPNRQGGPIVQNALEAADKVIYAAVLTEDGLDGVDGAAKSVRQYGRYRTKLGAPVNLREVGIIVGAVKDTIATRDSKRVADELEAAYGSQLLRPFVPWRVIVAECRAAGLYFGFWDSKKGQEVHQPYMTLTRTVLAA